MARRLISFIIICAVSAAALAFILTQSFTTWDFRNNLWGPAHLLLSGRDPYRVGALFEWWTNAVWMPPAIGQFWWMGALPEAIASNIWFVGSIAGYLAGAFLVLRRAGVTLVWQAVLLLCALVFMPFFTHLTLGQYSIAAMVLMLVAFYLRGYKQPMAAGVLCALALAKPQLLVLPLIGYAYSCLRRGALRDLALFSCALALTFAVLTLPLWLGFPGWVDGWLDALSILPEWQHPTLYATFGNLWGAAGVAIAMVVAVTALILNLERWRRDPSSAIVWSMGLNLVFVPYVWSWDAVLVVPLFLHVTACSRRPFTRIIMVVLFAWLWLFDVQLRLVSDRNDGHFWWIPSAMLCIIVLGWFIDKRFSPMLSSRALAHAE